MSASNIQVTTEANTVVVRKIEKYIASFLCQTHNTTSVRTDLEKLKALSLDIESSQKESKWITR